MSETTMAQLITVTTFLDVLLTILLLYLGKTGKAWKSRQPHKCKADYFIFIYSPLISGDLHDVKTPCYYLETHVDIYSMRLELALPSGLNWQLPYKDKTSTGDRHPVCLLSRNLD